MCTSGCVCVCVVSNQVIVILSVQVSVCECVFSERDVLGVCVSVLFCVCVCQFGRPSKQSREAEKCALPHAVVPPTEKKDLSILHPGV